MHLKIYFQSINTEKVETFTSVVNKFWKQFAKTHSYNVLPFISMVAAECCFSKLSILAERIYVISKFLKVYITFLLYRNKITISKKTYFKVKGCIQTNIEVHVHQ